MRTKRKVGGLVFIGMVIGLFSMGMSDCDFPWKPESENKARFYYSDLSEIYNGSFQPTWADWLCLNMVATLNSEQYLTENILIKTFVARLENAPNSLTTLLVLVDTDTQPSWDRKYLGKGKFTISDRELRAEYQKATDYIFQLIRNYFPSDSLLSDNKIEVHFAINGNEVGTAKRKIFRLLGDLPNDSQTPKNNP